MTTELAQMTCPQCATINTYEELVPHADNFCTQCDFPLFWDQMHVPVVMTDEESDEAHRRLPGVGGRDRVRMRACPACAEPNPIVNVTCMRCASVMELPPPPPEPPTEIVEVVTTVEHPRGPDWLLVALVVLVLAVVVFLVAYAVGQA